MATFKATVRGERKDGFLQVYIRVTHNKRHGYIKTDKMVTRKEPTKTNEIKDPFVMNYCTERFFGTNQIMFGHLTSMQMNRWIKSLEGTHRAKEMYPVCMRQVFRAATDELNDYDNGIIRIKTNPWGKVKIPQADRAEKKAISAEECRAFFSAPLPQTRMIDPLPELGRDVAKSILCLAGINTVYA